MGSADGLARARDPGRAPRSRGAPPWDGDRAPRRPDARTGRDGNDGAHAVRGLRRRPRAGGNGGRLRRSQHPPDRLQEPGRSPLPAGDGREVRGVVLAARQRDLPLRALRALRRPGPDARRRRQPHDPVGLVRDDRDRRRRSRRRGLHGRASVRASLPQDRRRPPGERPFTAVGAGQGRDPRAPAPAGGARRPRVRVRVHRAGPGDAELHGARHDRQHDRGAGCNGSRLSRRRADPRLAGRARSFRGLRRARDRQRRRLRRGGGDRPRGPRPPGRQALEPRQRRAGGRARRHRAGPGVHRLVGQLVLRRPGPRGRRAPQRSALRAARLRDGDSRFPADPRPDHAQRHLRRPPRRGRADARAGVRAVRRHGPGSALGLGLPPDVQPELPRPERDGGRPGLPVLSRRGGRLHARGRDHRPARAP